MASSIALRSSAILISHSSNIPSYIPSHLRSFRLWSPRYGVSHIKTLTLNLLCSCSSTPLTSTPASPSEEESGERALQAAVEALDIRVGRIQKVWRHPEADSLYVEEVDMGEPEPRTICSGLVNYIQQDHLQDKNVVVLANLKPRNMRGIKSNGMLMAASDVAHENVELLMPPEGSVPGERIWFGSDAEANSQPDAASPNQVQKKKIWETVQPHLKTTDNCVAVFKDRPMRTSAGLVTCSSLKNANIS
ncbi:hypothetical protein SUGI_0963160 [Cryptomeria japonica]|uniref:uncharacterized protein LOC131042824 n=1 Tax=Cryptomeria japonica TaxID=3369 RepID=UPI002414BAD5|nr:uncharacterized protein LOC131042824 [Cryptomeria japonica]GLJ45768.1 hypothetical protein SUGI_0963160 [Cryptomeria japonica]